MKKRHWILALVMAVVLLADMNVAAEEMLGSNRRFRINNPDGIKYEFARDYITSLNYLKENNERFEDVAILAFSEDKEIDRIAALRDDLIRNNLNLRIARNYLSKYLRQADNGLILKASDMFTNFCDRLIDLNNEEKLLLEDLYYTQLKDEMDGFDVDGFTRSQRRIGQARKTTLKELLETTILVSKILISPQENYAGQFDRLGITQEERYKLLYKIDEFEDDRFKGELRPGLTFLEGSVVTLREILEDYDYTALDG